MANEKRLIDKKSAWKTAQRIYSDPVLLHAIKNTLDTTPTVDVVEVKHGRWQPHYEIFDADPAVGILGGNYQTGWQCSVCGRYESIQEPYCNCGAKMDGDQK